jgi:uncharacterized protein (TIGR03083 family)
MTLPREDVVGGLIVELDDFESLVRSLDAAELAEPSRCGDWSAGDVAAHVIGQIADVTAGRFDGLGTPEVTQRQVEERRGRSGAELGDELATATTGARDLLAIFDDAAWNGPSPAGGSTLGAGVEALWFDAYLHADDIRAAVGRPTQSGPGVRASISHLGDVLTDQGHPPLVLELDGVEVFTIAGGSARRDGAGRPGCVRPRRKGERLPLRRAPGQARSFGESRAPRMSRPGSSPVGVPCSKVTTPDFTVAR